MEAYADNRRISAPRTSSDADRLIHAFCFLSLLLIGADRFGVEIGGVNFRLDQLFLAVFALLLLAKGTFRITANFWVFGFVFFSAVSTVLALNFVRAFAFWLSIVYNVFFLFYALGSYVQRYGLERMLRIFRATCFVQFAALLFQLALKVLFHYELPFLPSYGYYMGVPRFQLWFYEPSYLATYLSFWFAFACLKLIVCGERKYLPDVLCGLIMFIVTTSTSGFIAIALVLFSVYLIWIARRITLKKLIFPFGVILLFFAFRFGFSQIYDTFIARLFEGSINAASGGRIESWAETWQVFLENPAFGVGPGCYGLYLGKDVGYVPLNVSLELLATLGIFGFLFFYGLTASLIFRAVKLGRQKKTKQTNTLACLAYALLIFTIILQINQGYLRLYHWAFLGILWGGLLSRPARTQEAAV